MTAGEFPVSRAPWAFATEQRARDEIVGENMADGRVGRGGFRFEI